MPTAAQVPRALQLRGFLNTSLYPCSKYYTFDWHAPAAAKTVSFSSYPGYLESLDDFYMMSSGLGTSCCINAFHHSVYLPLVSTRMSQSADITHVLMLLPSNIPPGMTQTSNGIMNNSLLDLITPKSLLAWQRVRVASAFSATAEQWSLVIPGTSLDFAAL